MSFYIRSFRLMPQALEKKEAVPNNTTFTLATDIVCRKHSNHDKYIFKYYAGEKLIAESLKDCSYADENHTINDSIDITSDNWGNGKKIKIPITVLVIQESSGATLNNETTTWVEQ